MYQASPVNNGINYHINWCRISAINSKIGLEASKLQENRIRVLHVTLSLEDIPGFLGDKSIIISVVNGGDSRLSFHEVQVWTITIVHVFCVFTANKQRIYRHLASFQNTCKDMYFGNPPNDQSH